MCARPVSLGEKIIFAVCSSPRSCPVHSFYPPWSSSSKNEHPVRGKHTCKGGTIQPLSIDFAISPSPCFPTSPNPTYYSTRNDDSATFADECANCRGLPAHSRDQSCGITFLLIIFHPFPALHLERRVFRAPFFPRHTMVRERILNHFPSAGS